MKFDMNDAWSRALTLFRGNRDLVLVTAGVFFALPYLALFLTLPQMIGEVPQQGATPEAMEAFIRGLPAMLWWVVILVGLVQWVGTLGLLALVGDQTRPTLGSALKRGFIALAPYLAAQLVVTLGMQLLALAVQVLVGQTGSPGLRIVTDMLIIAAMLYVMARFSLTGPAMVLEGSYNPVRALRRSFALTAGNGVRLAVFYLLVGLAALILGIVVFFVVTLPFSLGGADAATIGAALVLAAVIAVVLVLMMAVTAAAYRQLAAGGAGQT